MSVTTFSAAVRAVLDSEQERTNMRSLARQAVSHLPDDLVVEAAVTYLTQLARREHNNRVRSEGTEGLHSDEVVWTKEGDKTLGKTTDADRRWLISNRETLANGLYRRADQIRELGPGGPTLEQVSLQEVLAAEKQAEALAHMKDSLSALLSRDASGETAASREARERTAAAEQRVAKATERSARYRKYADALQPEAFIGVQFKRTRRAAVSLARLFREEVHA